jgi:hypothetical protein
LKVVAIFSVLTFWTFFRDSVVMPSAMIMAKGIECISKKQKSNNKIKINKDMILFAFSI